MSNWRQQWEDESESKAVLTWLTTYYHYPVLVVLIGFAFWNRIRNWSNFLVDGEVLLTGNDPWYHLRSTHYVVNNFPQTMPFDPWTRFPFGTFTEQFGTIFNQVIALVALVVGLGNPSEQLVNLIFLVSTPFLTVILCIPAYLIGERVGGRMGGLVTVAFIAFAPDRLLSVTIAGSVDHHAVEVLSMSLGVLGVMIALTVAEREKPVYELLEAREFDALRQTLGWSILAGIGVGLYMWTWPPGMWLFGILAVFFVLHLSIEHVRGRSPEHTAFVGATATTTAAIMQLSTTRALELGATSRSFVQPGFGLAVAAGIVFLAWLSREVDARDLSPYAYPATVAGTMVVSAGLIALLLPGLFDFFVGQTDRVLGFVTSPGTAAGTIGEATPMDPNQLFDFYGLGIFTAVAGGVLVVIRQVIRSEPRSEELLVVVWFVFVVLASLTQLRFGYYLTIVVGALNAVLIGAIMTAMTPEDDEFGIETYQIITVTAIVLLLFVPLLAVSPTAMAAADQGSQPGDVVGWDDSLDWMSENTPAEGQFAHPDAEPMELYGEFTHTDDFDYPDGAYGVMSWWDYGHWITIQGERIPNANPFQQGSNRAANFLLAPNETAAMERLRGVDDHDEAKTRYVMVDWKMVETESARPVRGKFFAPPEFKNGVQQSTYYSRMTATENGRTQFVSQFHKQAYYESMVVRLYHYHGSAQRVEPIVTQWQGEEREFPEGSQLEGQSFRSVDNVQPVRLFDDVEGAREYVNDTRSTQLGGIGPYPEERVPALEHFRLVYMDEISALPRTEEDIAAQEHGVFFGLQIATQRTVEATGLLQELQGQFPDSDAQQLSDIALRFLYPNTPAWTKTFERVPGGTVAGSGPANRTVTLSVELDPENGRNFTYTQQVETDANGEFNTTVPYSTTGYDEWGVEAGYTNVAVEATGPYTVRTDPVVDGNGTLVRHTGEVEVTEGQVIGEDESAATVTLEEEVLGESEESLGDESTDEEGTDGSTDDGGTTSDNTTEGGS